MTFGPGRVPFDTAPGGGETAEEGRRTCPHIRRRTLAARRRRGYGEGMAPDALIATRRSAGEVMSARVVTVELVAGRAEIARLLSEHGVSALPVVDERGGLVGIVTEHDLIHKASVPSSELTAKALMSSPVHTVDPDTSLSEAAVRMRDRHIKRLPVVDGGHLVGILSRGDLLRAYLLDEAGRAALLSWIVADEEPEALVERGSELETLIALIEEQRPPLV
jgi:CBS domain-containing protein